MRFLALLLVAASASAQPVAFGSADDALELGSGFSPRDRTLAAVYAGPAYLPDTWRGALRAEAYAMRGRWSAGLGATVHPGAGGLYGPEADDLEDIARVIEYVRWNATAGNRSYARLGPTQQVTLGSGALVRRYRTTTAWDERSIGLEAAHDGRRVRLAGFVDDVLRLGGILGGEASVQTTASVGPLDDLRATIALVHDLGGVGVSGDSSLTGGEVTISGRYGRRGPLALRPFATHARYTGHGSTLGGGIQVGIDNLGDVLRGRAMVAAFASTDDFVPGHVGPFYAISNATDRIVDDASFFSAEADALAGTQLDSVGTGVDLVLDLSVIAFGRLEVSQHLRRHIGDERASAYSLRLAGRLPGQGRVAFELERQDFRGFFDLLGDLGPLNSLILDVQLPVGSSGVVYVRSRYGYRRLTEDDGPAYTDGAPRFLVERRFEPLVGLRLSL